MIRIENYTFKKKQPVGKYRTLVEYFIDSKEKLMAWECNDELELKRVVQGFQSVIHKRNLKNMVKVKQCTKDLVVGLERVSHE